MHTRAGIIQNELHDSIILGKLSSPTNQTLAKEYIQVPKAGSVGWIGADAGMSCPVPHTQTIAVRLQRNVVPLKHGH